MQILREDKQINITYNIKFLRLAIHRAMSWKVHIDEITSKLNKECYLIRSDKPFMSLEVFLMFALL
jgi:formaldehyde-activating enzyme involved in methanogenesis